MKVSPLRRLSNCQDVSISSTQLVWNESYTQPYLGNLVPSLQSIQEQLHLQNTSLPPTVSLEVNLKPQKLYITHLNFYFIKQQLKKIPKNLTGFPWHTFNQLAQFSSLSHYASLSHLRIFPRTLFAYLYQIILKETSKQHFWKFNFK